MDDITNLAHKLQNLGLPLKEAQIYLVALFLGASPAQKIAEQAGFNRVTTYAILNELKEKGLITQSKQGKKTVFIAEEPEALEKIFVRDIQDIQRRHRELKILLPQFRAKSRPHEAPIVRFYRGKDGIMAISQYMRRKARRGSMVYGVTNVDEVKRLFPVGFNAFQKERVKKDLSSKVLYSGGGEIKSDTKLMRQMVRTPSPVKADLSIYENAASLSTYSGKEVIGILIESPDIVAELRRLFELAWEGAKKEEPSDKKKPSKN